MMYCYPLTLVSDQWMHNMGMHDRAIVLIAF